jgi:multidrug resistance efflux pump
VRSGEIIARLDPQILQLQVESAVAELAEATSSLAQAETDFRALCDLAELERRAAERAIGPQAQISCPRHHCALHSCPKLCSVYEKVIGNL